MTLRKLQFLFLKKTKCEPRFAVDDKLICDCVVGSQRNVIKCIESQRAVVQSVICCVTASYCQMLDIIQYLDHFQADLLHGSLRKRSKLHCQLSHSILYLILDQYKVYNQMHLFPLHLISSILSCCEVNKVANAIAVSVGLSRRSARARRRMTLQLQLSRVLQYYSRYYQLRCRVLPVTTTLSTGGGSYLQLSVCVSHQTSGRKSQE